MLERYEMSDVEFEIAVSHNMLPHVRIWLQLAWREPWEQGTQSHIQCGTTNVALNTDQALRLYEMLEAELKTLGVDLEGRVIGGKSQ